MNALIGVVFAAVSAVLLLVTYIVARPASGVVMATAR